MVEGDAAIPGVFGPQRGVPPGWVPCFCWLKQEEDEEEPTTVQKHSREGYNLAALLFFFLFLDNLLRRVEGQAWKGFWLCSGRLEVVVLFGVLSLVAQFVYCRGLSAASIKSTPETLTVTFEEFSPTHDFFDYTVFQGRAQSELCGETQLTSTWHHQKLARPGRPSAARCFGLCQRNRLFLSHKG